MQDSSSELDREPSADPLGDTPAAEVADEGAADGAAQEGAAQDIGCRAFRQVTEALGVLEGAPFDRDRDRVEGCDLDPAERHPFVDLDPHLDI